MNSSQRQYLAGLVRYEFGVQGFRPEITQSAQIDAAVSVLDRAIKAHASGTLFEITQLAVTVVRNAHLSNVAPSQRTVATCNCGKPKAPHSPSLHGAR